MHLDRLDFSGHVGRSKGDDHTGLDDTGLDTADGYCADTADLVHILERETEGLVGGSLRGLDGVDGLEEGLTLGRTGFGLLGPALVPWHATPVSTKPDMNDDTHLAESSNMLSPCHPEMGTNGTDLGL